ncbi:hypothetical protein [Haloferula sp. A504]|uniref:hypothetical protein n=1 Tax=Haloferula sp. A504 TaxID=3373601 RepID=UPI0031C2E669|nr:hypothetical protein [Verrucomicrobiaceae bacterium E54]
MMRAAAIALLLAVSPPAAGQDGSNGGATAEFRVTRFDPADRPSPTFRVGSTDSRVEVEVPLTYIAGPHQAPLRDGRFLDFWRGDAEKPEITLSLAEAERKDLLLIFFPKDDTYHVVKVHAPSTRIRGGDRYIVNATRTELAIKLGDGAPLFVASGKTGLLRGPRSADAVSLPVLISLKKDGEWKLASTENWPCDPRFRKYLFAYISPRSRHLVFHSVSERL